MKNKLISMYYGEKKQELQLTSASSYLQAFIIPKDRCASFFSPATDLKFLCRVVCMASTLSELTLLLHESQNVESTALVKNNAWYGFWIAYFARKRAELFHCKYTELVGFADALEISINVLNAMGRPISFLVEPLQRMLDLMLCRYLEEVTKEERNQNLCNQIVNDSKESLDAEDGDVLRSGYLSTKEYCLER